MEPATLYIVPTPIGNLEDITLRALKVLKEVDTILCEDTRTSSYLLKHYEITRPLQAYHQHNEHKIVSHLADQLEAGKIMALITDAGTPGISDPAFLLVRECIKRNIRVECLPGAAAFVPALVVSGIPCDTFHFEGFLPHKKGRQTRLKFLAELPCTIVFYESPHRVIRTISQFAEYFGQERKASVSREISKMFETYHRGQLQDQIAYFKEHVPKGEIVMLIKGKED